MHLFSSPPAEKDLSDTDRPEIWQHGHITKNETQIRDQIFLIIQRAKNPPNHTNRKYKQDFNFVWKLYCTNFYASTFTKNLFLAELEMQKVFILAIHTIRLH